MLAGLVAMRVLPIAQYPEIAPPVVTVTATYPGATAETLAQTVAAPLEEQINGVENMIYMQLDLDRLSGTLQISRSRSRSAPTSTRTRINVNNRVQRAAAAPAARSAPPGRGRCRSARPSILQVLALSSPDDRYDTLFISNYAPLNVLDELKRVPGVGDAAIFGATDYSMRIWLRPDKLAQYNLTPGRRRRRDARAERAVRRRQGRRGADDRAGRTSSTR